MLLARVWCLHWLSACTKHLRQFCKYLHIPSCCMIMFNLYLYLWSCYTPYIYACTQYMLVKNFCLFFIYGDPISALTHYLLGFVICLYWLSDCTDSLTLQMFCFYSLYYFTQYMLELVLAHTCYLLVLFCCFYSIYDCNCYLLVMVVCLYALFPCRRCLVLLLICLDLCPLVHIMCY